nr:PREDICTED: uncharacterized protein LOC109031769 isoform X1 [Bemisia tabaci]
MVACSVPLCSCRSSSTGRRQHILQQQYEIHAGRKISFHSFPSDKELCKAWLTKLKIKNFEPSKNSRVCSLHFEKDSFFGFPATRNVLKPNAVPSIITPHWIKIGHGRSTRDEMTDLKAQADVYCAVRGCKNLRSKIDAKNKVSLNSHGKPVSYYQFPEDKELRQKWITATGRNLTHSSIQARMAVCSAHFDKSCFATVGKVKLLSQDAVPTIDLPISKLFHQEKEILSHQIECHSNVQNPSITKIVQQVQGKTLTGSTPVSHSNVSSPPEILATTGSLKSQAPILSKTKDLSPSQNNTPINSKAQTTPINMMMLPKQPEAMMVQRQESNVVIKNDLMQPVVFVKTPNKVMVVPAKSVAQERLAQMPNASTVHVKPNSYISVQPPISTVPEVPRVVPEQAVKKIPDCTCPTDKFFREGGKQIRILSDREHKLRSKNATKARMLKSLLLSRNRCDEKARSLKKKTKELRNAIEKSERGVPLEPATVKLFKEILQQHSEPINLDGPLRKQYGKQMKKFASELFTASPEAYVFVREAFNKRLPRLRTVRAWCSKEQAATESNQSETVDQNDSDLDDEGTECIESSDEEVEELQKKIREETNVTIEAETDQEGNILNDPPAELDEEMFSDLDSDSDFEMPFSSLCEQGLLTPLEPSKKQSKFPSKPSNSPASGTPNNQTKKQDMLIKINLLENPKLGPGVRFETFAI